MFFPFVLDQFWFLHDCYFEILTQFCSCGFSYLHASLGHTVLSNKVYRKRIVTPQFIILHFGSSNVGSLKIPLKIIVRDGRGQFFWPIIMFVIIILNKRMEIKTIAAITQNARAHETRRLILCCISSHPSCLTSYHLLYLFQMMQGYF